MELQQLNCCGIFELIDIGDDSYYHEYIGFDGPEKRIPRKQGVDACVKNLRNTLASIEPKGRLVFASTISEGYSRETAALKRLRFRVVRRFRNGNSGSNVTVWQKLVR